MDKNIENHLLTKKEHWENIYQNVSKCNYPDPLKKRADWEIAYLFRNIFAKYNVCKIIEMGCGNSAWLPYLKFNYNVQVVGVDYTIDGVDSALHNLSCRNLKGKILQRDFLNNETMKEQWGHNELVYSLGVVEHFTDPEVVIEKFSELLKINGLMLTIIPNMSGFCGRIQKLLDLEVYNLHNPMTLDQLCQYHKNAGMDIVEYGNLGALDLTMLNYSRFKYSSSIWRLMRALDIPMLVISKIIGKPINADIVWHSLYYVLAKKSKTN